MNALAAIATAVIGLAVIAVLVKSSNTSSVIQAGTSGFASIINSAMGNGLSTGSLGS
jgi:PRD1 phage membrane DNA delivery